MRVVLQRVSSASVDIEGKTVGQIGRGFLVLAAVHGEDTLGEIEKMADKVAGLRVFEDGEGKMNLSLSDVGGALLVISNFTLYSDCKKAAGLPFFNQPGRRRQSPYMNIFCIALKRPESRFNVVNSEPTCRCRW